MSDWLSVEWLGETSYADALALQHEAVSDRLKRRTADRLILLEHPKVITLGRSTDRANLRFDEARLRELRIELFEVGRGGDITYHAPGQLVGYPIIDLDALGRRDVHAHLRSLQAGLRRAIPQTVFTNAKNFRGAGSSTFGRSHGEGYGENNYHPAPCNGPGGRNGNFQQTGIREP